MDVEADLGTLTRGMGLAIRAERAARGMSLGDLGRASGLSKTILARIERGEGNPSVETLWRVSQALRIPLGALLTPSARPKARLIRQGEGEALHSESGMDAWLLHAEGREHRSEIFDITLPKGADQRSEPHLP